MSNTLRWIVFFIVLVIVGILLYSVFRHKEPVNDAMFKELIATKDSLIAEKQKSIKAIEALNKELDNSIRLHEINDSLLRNKVTIINHRYEQIPVTVRNYSDQQLLDSAISKYSSPD